MDNMIFFAGGLAATVAVILLIKRSTQKKPDITIRREKRSARPRTTTKNGKKLRR